MIRVVLFLHSVVQSLSKAEICTAVAVALGHWNKYMMASICKSHLVHYGFLSGSYLAITIAGLYFLSLYLKIGSLIVIECFL